MSYTPAVAALVTVTRTGPDGRSSSWTGRISHMRETGFTLTLPGGERVGFAGPATAGRVGVLAQSIVPVHELGDRVVFDSGSSGRLVGTVVRVWSEPNAPYVTVLSEEPRPRRFVRMATAVQAAPAPAA